MFLTDDILSSGVLPVHFDLPGNDFSATNFALMASPSIAAPPPPPPKGKIIDMS